MNDHEPERLSYFWTLMILGTLVLVILGCMVVFWWLTR